ncbi:MAG TPA: hypothetical protein VLX85_01375 [Stellaceae bacterium]|nr:hypothetical protein [Stellaceae bacterium]
MDAPPDDKARLRAIESLLDYVISECGELDLPELEQLLGAAALVVGEMIEGRPATRRPRRSDKPALRIVTGDAPVKKRNAEA